jgi:catechol 2,3-dioxygenase-like lactoylglutathione lyase family enzyme
MFTAINPKLPMRDKAVSRDYYVNQLGFKELGDPHFKPYLMVEKDGIEIHFFEYKDLDPSTNYGQVYIRTNDIGGLYQTLLDNQVTIHPNGPLQAKPWGQLEFSLLDPDNNLLTFGQKI